MSGALLRYDAACRALAEAKTVDEVASWSDKAAAVREYARRINNRSLELDAAEIKERAERRRGELLLELKATGVLAEGRAAATVTDQGQLLEKRVTLEELNTSRNESSRAQRIASIPPAQFEQLLVASRQELEQDARRHALDVLRERDGPITGARTVMASRQEPDESLDFSPTPPFATRALFEHVFPHLGVTRVDQVWEPACGEGHMTAVIEEYAKGTVVGTDIFDYSRDGRMPPAWWRTLDFLDEKEETPVVEWIITNPPFKHGEAFALRAIELIKNAASSGGVALFVRWQWIETVDRYNNLFKPYPPTLVCPFVERVPLHMGRWEPDGSTATAYCFVVWMPWRVPRGPTELFWIPPGCRTGLTRPNDRERFTAHPVTAWKPAAPTMEQPAPAAINVQALIAALSGLKLSLNERLHVRAMANRATDGVAIAGRDEGHLVDIARKYGVDVSPPSGLLTDAARAALASAFSTSPEAPVGTAETPLPTLQEVKPCP